LRGRFWRSIRRRRRNLFGFEKYRQSVAPARAAWRAASIAPDAQGRRPGEDAIEPELEPKRRGIVAGLDAISDVARQMREAGLLAPGMALLRAVAIGGPHFLPRAIHGFAHDLGGAGEIGGVNDGVFAAKYPMKGVDAFDAHAGFVDGDKIRLAQNAKRLRAPVLESLRRAGEHVHQRARTERQAEQIEEKPLQPLIGQGVAVGTLRPGFEARCPTEICQTAFARCMSQGLGDNINSA
jgi:hypothetical protein